MQKVIHAEYIFLLFDIGVVSDVGFGWDCPGMQQCSSLDGLSISVRLPKLPGVPAP